MGYVQELRQRVGSRPLILAGASVLLLNDRRQLLMLRRTDNLCWGIPGGCMEPGESIEQTARREAQEETSLTLGALHLFGVFSGQELFYQYPNGDQVYIVTVTYLCRDFKGRFKLSDGEHTQAGFFELTALPQPISPPIQPILKALLDAAATQPII